MSVLIKGIDLPEAYGPAVLTVYECIDGHGIPKEYKLSATQMQAIPPHGRLIDADELINTLQELFNKNEEEARFTGNREAAVTWNDAIYHIKIAPTIVEAEKGDPDVSVD